MVRDSAMVTMDSLYQTAIALSNGTIADPLRPPLPQMGSQVHYQDHLRGACCHLANMVEDIDKTAVCCVVCHYEPSDVTFCEIILWPLFTLGTIEIYLLTYLLARSFLY